MDERNARQALHDAQARVSATTMQMQQEQIKRMAMLQGGMQATPPVAHPQLHGRPRSHSAAPAYNGTPSPRPYVIDPSHQSLAHPTSISASPTSRPYTISPQIAGSSMATRNLSGGMVPGQQAMSQLQIQAQQQFKLHQQQQQQQQHRASASQQQVQMQQHQLQQQQQYELLQQTSQGRPGVLGRSLPDSHTASVKLRQRQSMVAAIPSAQYFPPGHPQFNPFAAHPDEPREPANPILYPVQIRRGTLQAVKLLGSGQYGEVLLAKVTSLQTGEVSDCAVKVLKQGATHEDKADFISEAEIMLELHHENLVRMLGVAVQQRPWLTVLELCKHGDLATYLRRCSRYGATLNFREQRQICVQISAGMAFMEQSRCVHMDLAARNVMLADGNVAKVGDFGLTKKLDAASDYYRLDKALKLPIAWMAIESLTLKVFSCKSDVWGFGVVLWELFAYADVPYKGIPLENIQEQVENGMRLQPPSAMPEAFYYSVVEACWSLDPRHRPDFARLAECIYNFPEITKNNEIKSTSIRDLGKILDDAKRALNIPGLRENVIHRRSPQPSSSPRFGVRTPTVTGSENTISIQRANTTALQSTQSTSAPHADATVTSGATDESRSQVAGSVTSDDVGFRVTVKGKCQGILRYVGPLTDPTPLYAGVELDDPIGESDGSFKNSRYFTCAANHAFFCELNRISKESYGSDVGGGATVPRDNPKESQKEFVDLDFNGFTSSDIGAGVEVDGYGEGVVKFVGLHVHEKTERIGVELDEPVGKNNGTVRGHNYFTAPEKCGVLCDPRKVHRMGFAPSDVPSVRSSVVLSDDDEAPPVLDFNGFNPSDVGCSVEVQNLGQGILRFVGLQHQSRKPVVGVELLVPNGDNGGIFAGHKYFECKAEHGILTIPTEIARVKNVDKQTHATQNTPLTVANKKVAASGEVIYTSGPKTLSKSIDPNGQNKLYSTPQKSLVSQIGPNNRQESLVGPTLPPRNANEESSRVPNLPPRVHNVENNNTVGTYSFKNSATRQDADAPNLVRATDPSSRGELNALIQDCNVGVARKRDNLQQEKELTLVESASSSDKKKKSRLTRVLHKSKKMFKKKNREGGSGTGKQNALHSPSSILSRNKQEDAEARLVRKGRRVTFEGFDDVESTYVDQAPHTQSRILQLHEGNVVEESSTDGPPVRPYSRSLQIRSSRQHVADEHSIDVDTMILGQTESEQPPSPSEELPPSYDAPYISPIRHDDSCGAQIMNTSSNVSDQALPNNEELSCAPDKSYLEDNDSEDRETPMGFRFSGSLEDENPTGFGSEVSPEVSADESEEIHVVHDNPTQKSSTASITISSTPLRRLSDEEDDDDDGYIAVGGSNQMETNHPSAPSTDSQMTKTVGRKSLPQVPVTKSSPKTGRMMPVPPSGHKRSPNSLRVPGRAIVTSRTDTHNQTTPTTVISVSSSSAAAIKEQTEMQTSNYLDEALPESRVKLSELYLDEPIPKQHINHTAPPMTAPPVPLSSSDDSESESEI